MWEGELFLPIVWGTIIVLAIVVMIWRARH